MACSGYTLVHCLLAVWDHELERRRSSLLVPPPSAHARSAAVLGRVQRETANNMPEVVKSWLKVKNIISEDNIKVAVKSLARGSSAGVDGMPLELYLGHLDEMAPALSALLEPD